MAGSEGLFDSTQYTAASEYGSRQGERIDTLQIHHATMTSLSGLIGMMQPGGRTVSANGALSNTGHLVEVVPLKNRPFTSASAYDRRCLTVECCNTTLSPNWGISDATHERLARLAVAMYRKGLLGSLTRRHIIGHFEVPGTYATACPGPSMDLDRIVRRANELHVSSPAGSDPVGVANVVKGNLMEAYVQAPNGVVVHVFGGGKHNFKDPGEYNAWRSEVEFYKKQGVASNIMTPPALSEVPKLSTWAAFERLCKNVGAPLS